MCSVAIPQCPGSLKKELALFVGYQTWRPGHHVRAVLRDLAHYPLAPGPPDLGPHDPAGGGTVVAVC